MIEGHGDDMYNFGNEIKYNFSSNIYQGFDHSGLLEHLAACKNLLSIYPEPIPKSLEKEIAERFSVSGKNVMLTAGSTDSIYTIAFAEKNSRSIIVEPTFAEYEDACRLHGHKVEFITENDIYSIKSIEADLFWICNPNNPTGNVIECSFLEHLIADNPKVLFVIDAAYEDYTKACLPSAELYVKKPNVVMMHSLTKKFGVPGLRVGFVTGHSEIMECLKRFRMPWSIGSPAIEGARYLISHESDYKIPVDSLLEEAEKMRVSLGNSGIDVIASETNYMLCRLPYGKSYELKNFLAEDHGILIRDASNFHGLDESYFRIAVQSESSNELLLNKIKEWLSLRKS